MKITIIGYSGSGKSTLAEKLSNYYSIPKLHMDTLQFQPGWQDSDCEWMLTEIKNFLTKHKPQLCTPNLKTIQNPCLSLDPGWFL
ncbi:P-loop NTPase family protein, partial [Streptococcus pneumoniae]